eukprot:scaffold48578_cov68-Attheya_sp.AAC.2
MSSSARSASNFAITSSRLVATFVADSLSFHIVVESDWSILLSSSSSSSVRFVGSMGSNARTSSSI